MNLKNSPTAAELSALLMTCDDNSYHHIMWVDFDGEVHISPVPEDLTPVRWAETMGGKIKFRYETYCHGNEHVGPKAASDQNYLETVLGYLNRDWANDANGYIDF